MVSRAPGGKVPYSPGWVNTIGPLLASGAQLVRPLSAFLQTLKPQDRPRFQSANNTNQPIVRQLIDFHNNVDAGIRDVLRPQNQDILGIRFGNNAARLAGLLSIDDPIALMSN